MVHGGLCLAHDDQGATILVEGGIPGEEVEVSVRYRKGATSFAEVVRLTGRPGAHVGGDDVDWVADQQHVAEAQCPAQVHVAGDVVCHVLGVVDAAARRQRCGELGDSFGDVSRRGGEDRLARRMVDAGAVEIGRVERLIDDDRVRSVLERAHHRCGDVPRARPHRHAHDVVWMV